MQLGISPKINKCGGSNNCVSKWVFSPKINKHGGSNKQSFANKACSQEIFLKKKNKKNLLETSEQYVCMQEKHKLHLSVLY